jgi:hypothetical protein
MPQIFPLGSPRISFDSTKGVLVDLPGLALSGSTLGELLASLEQATGDRVIPDNGSEKYFLYFSGRAAGNPMLVDIHILRDGQEICPKQDLSFALLDSDKVVAGPLAC